MECTRAVEVSTDGDARRGRRARHAQRSAHRGAGRIRHRQLTPPGAVPPLRQAHPCTRSVDVGADGHARRHARTRHPEQLAGRCERIRTRNRRPPGSGRTSSRRYSERSRGQGHRYDDRQEDTKQNRAHGTPPCSTRLPGRSRGYWTVHLRVASGQWRRMDHFDRARGGHGQPPPPCLPGWFAGSPPSSGAKYAPEEGGRTYASQGVHD